ncbi:MAG: hypothetical protein JNJ53_01520 [Rhizobiales bacterium]|nr:hypothetical protein [Hyphomicrobiales bacterium]
MAETPSIKVTGAGSRREAARLGQTIGDGVAAALAGHDRAMHIDRLRLRLPAGASPSEIAGAIRDAVDGKTKGGRG